MDQFVAFGIFGCRLTPNRNPPMPRFVLALALAALGATGTLAVARSASALTDDFSIDGESTSPRPCGRGRKYFCYYQTTTVCLAFDAANQCTQYVTRVTAYYRD